MEALRGDRTSQMIAAAQRGYPNQVSGLQRQAVGRLGQAVCGRSYGGAKPFDG